MEKFFAALARFLALAVPFTIYIGMLAAIYLPGGSGMFNDGPDPWYASITGPLFFLGLFFSMPVKWISDMAYGSEAFLSPQYLIVLALYAALVAYGLHRMVEAIFRREERRGSKPGY